MGNLNPRQLIRVRLEAAREQWEQACHEVAAWEGLYRDGGAKTPDGLEALRIARLRLGFTDAMYRQMLGEFAEIVLRQ